MNEINRSIQINASPEETIRALQYSLSNIEWAKVFWSPNNSKVMLLTKEKSFLPSIFFWRNSYYKDAIQISVEGNVLSIETSNISSTNAEEIENILARILKGVSEYFSRNQTVLPSN